ncbi:phospholipid scramblase 2-like [Amphibalanus amphitrite]|uniref:phospholipid scramblase 2-like n=1 Tax=Amphibalanus amphitrite TaxID=1232801 RepID=UPI001C8FF987|nr:phospholipid scramblase 2-like [Amphibalanus amphitrite]
MDQVVTEQPAALGGPDDQSPSDADQDPAAAGADAAQQSVISGCPPGLEHLAVAHIIKIKQQVELAEVLAGLETANHYILLNEQNQQIYAAAEQSDCLARCCCGTSRAFDMLLIDNQRMEVARFVRHYRCCGMGWCSCWSRCCLQRMDVTRSGQLLGVVTQDPRPCSTSISVRTAEGSTALRVRRGCCRCAVSVPCCSCCCPGCRDVSFTISAEEDGRQVGVVTKKWSGAARELLTDADSFSLELQRDLDVRVKLGALAAVFLIDFMFFEH